MTKFFGPGTLALLEGLPEHGLARGGLGTVIPQFSRPFEAYEVEFVADGRSTRAMLALLPLSDRTAMAHGRT